MVLALVLATGACSGNDDDGSGDRGGGTDGATAGRSGNDAGGSAGSAGGGEPTAGSSAGKGSGGTDTSAAGGSDDAGTGGTGATTAGRSAGGSAGTGGTGGTSGTGASGGRGEPPEPDAELSPFIVVDQFGYRPSSKKVAVIRVPAMGFDAGESFEPGATYALIDAFSGESVSSGAPVEWRDGAVDESSGDRAYWFDFSSVTAESSYYVLDEERGVRSAVFSVAPGVYAEVLRHAVRTFFYQRAGQEKAAAFAGEGWADAASHVGPGQDREARLFSAKEDASTARDLSGGWYDAGDYNKYTNWHAGYVVQMLRAYRDRPEIWGDASNIPESGNDIPDIIDEALFGLDYLERLQEEDGSVLSIVGLAGGTPPSSATDPSFYGPSSTSATASAAAAFAYAAVVIGGIEGMSERADTLRSAAERAYAWASDNPSISFRNNDAGFGSTGLGAGQQEVDDKGRTMKRLEAACYLFELTGEASYRTFFDENHGTATLLASYAYGWEEEVQEMLLHYASLPGATESVAGAIRAAYASALESDENLGAHRNGIDPYLAPLTTYTWGSNAVKSHQGLVFHALVKYDFPDVDADEALAAAESYLHYLHGVNPLGLVYLSNMAGAGAERSANEFFHSWFADGSALWDRVGTSTYGPPPGFLTGGPNPSYGWDGCCPSGCSGVSCGAEPPSPPGNQPPQKSYLDFNTSWPLNSWSVTENSNGYQIAYIRLLSQFVE
ncbi:MAG TPA: glycoside hydrolase family 9 protein [Polyangiaceae bacterium]